MFMKRPMEKKNKTVFYYDTVNHWSALKRDDLSRYYVTHITVGFIYRDKEIEIDNFILIFDWLVELSDGTKYVFGKMSGGNGVSIEKHCLLVKIVYYQPIL